MVLHAFFQGPAALLGVGFVLSVSVVFFLNGRSTRVHNKNKPSRVIHALSGAVPVLGDLPEVLRTMDRRLDWVTDLCLAHNGDSFTMKVIGQPREIFVYTEKAVEDILKTHFRSFPKGPALCDLLSDVLGRGIFAVDGSQWTHQRKTASHLFTDRALRDNMTECMGHYTVVLQRILLQASEAQASIDWFKLMNRFTIEAFSKMAFGIDMNCLEAEHDHPFQAAFDGAQRMLLQRFIRPLWFWKLQRFLNVGAEGQMKRDIAVIDKTVLGIITQSLERRRGATQQCNDSSARDIVSLFLDGMDETSEPFDPTLLRDIVVNFLIAGRDTTAQAMSWFFFSVMKNPEIAEKIRQEIANEIPELASGQITSPSMAQVQRLTYLEATVKETLRLYPSVPLIPKYAAEDTLLSDGTLIPKGSSVRIPVYAMARLPSIWGDDAADFKPERWIDSKTGKIISVSAFKFVTFNAGPRTCLGMHLAMLEMKIVAASVLSRFHVELVAGQHITYDNSITLPMKGKMLVRVKALH